MTVQIIFEFICYFTSVTDKIAMWISPSTVIFRSFMIAEFKTVYIVTNGVMIKSVIIVLIHHMNFQFP